MLQAFLLELRASFLDLCQAAEAALRAQADFPGFNQTWILCLIDNITSLFTQVFLIYWKQSPRY